MILSRAPARMTHIPAIFPYRDDITVSTFSIPGITRPTFPNIIIITYKRRILAVIGIPLNIERTRYYIILYYPAGDDAAVIDRMTRQVTPRPTKRYSI